jgi:hypothetical protein
MKLRALLLFVAVSSVPACKKSDRWAMHTDTIGDTGWVIDVPKDESVLKDGDNFKFAGTISNYDGYIYVRDVEKDPVPNAEFAAGACTGANVVVKDEPNGGRSVTCYKVDGPAGGSQTHSYMSMAWIPDGKGKVYDCEFEVLGDNDKDASALAQSKKVCQSMRKK